MDKKITLRYDGKFNFVKGESRQWTIVSDFHDAQGQNRKTGSFMLKGLKDLGIVKEAK